jgi:hypothetical protein
LESRHAKKLRGNRQEDQAVSEHSAADQPTIDGTKLLIADLEAQKARLHPANTLTGPKKKSYLDLRPRHRQELAAPAGFASSGQNPVGGPVLRGLVLDALTTLAGSRFFRNSPSLAALPYRLGVLSRPLTPACAAAALTRNPGTDDGRSSSRPARSLLLTVDQPGRSANYKSEC